MRRGQWAVIMVGLVAVCGNVCAAERAKTTAAPSRASVPAVEQNSSPVKRTLGVSSMKLSSFEYVKANRTFVVKVRNMGTAAPTTQINIQLSAAREQFPNTWNPEGGVEVEPLAPGAEWSKVMPRHGEPAYVLHKVTLYDVNNVKLDERRLDLRPFDVSEKLDATKKELPVLPQQPE
jgi:hypothetical protein